MLSCTVCNTTCKTEQSFTRHQSSKKHISRTSGARLYGCGCGNSYLSRQSLYLHKQACTHFTTQVSVSDQLGHQQKEIKELKDQIKALQAQHPNRQREKCTYTVPNLEQPPAQLTELTTTIASQLRAKISCLEKELEQTKINTTVVRHGRRRINTQIRQMIATNQDNKCNDCNTTLTAYFQIDHMIGLQYGGTDEIENLQALCGDCHTKKSIIENRVRNKIRDAIRTIITEEDTASSIGQSWK